MGKTRQIRLPGLDDEMEPSASTAAPPPPVQVACANDESERTSEAIDDAEVPPAEPVEPSDVANGALPNLHGKTVYIVDAYSLIFQVFHAMPKMTSPRGEPVDGRVRLHARHVHLARAEEARLSVRGVRPRPGRRFATSCTSTTKQHRSEMPDGSGAADSATFAACWRPGHSRARVRSVRGRRLLATLARVTDEARRRVLPGHGRQGLPAAHHRPREDLQHPQEPGRIDAAALQDDWGIRPDQVVDFQALVGDSVDNIPGVPLIGPKIAGELLAEVRHAGRACWPTPTSCPKASARRT